jgi:hypothetical protein
MVQVTKQHVRNSSEMARMSMAYHQPDLQFTREAALIRDIDTAAHMLK